MRRVCPWKTAAKYRKVLILFRPFWQVALLPSMHANVLHFQGREEGNIEPYKITNI